MNPAAVLATLEHIANLEGLQACALLEADTGMAWLHATSRGEGDAVMLCEAATDYWRLHRRHADLFDDSFGGLAAQVVIHARSRLTLVACGQHLVLASISHEPDRVPWKAWKRLVGELQRQAAAF